jgi:carotenoid cleavage dioxygenase
LRFDAAVAECEVLGEIPRDIDGAFYRVGGEFYYPPLFADDAPLNADGYISMFRIRNGRVDFRGRWIETERLKHVRAAGRQLYGYYRNPYTDDPSVRDPARPNRRTVSNTAPLVHHGQLYALKEDGLPHRIDPNTLETIGSWDFAGAWKSQTFTAHPKIDPLSGELIAYGNEADGLASDALWIYRIGLDGAVNREVRTTVPYVSIMHDMALTQKHMIFPFAGYVTSRERLTEGKIHWGWDNARSGMIGVMPRDGEAKDMRWFEGPLRCMMHTFNAHDEATKVVLYCALLRRKLLPLLPERRWHAVPARTGAELLRTQDHPRHGSRSSGAGARKSSIRPALSISERPTQGCQLADPLSLYHVLTDPAMPFDSCPLDRASPPPRREQLRPLSTSPGDGRCAVLRRCPLRAARR